VADPRNLLKEAWSRLDAQEREDLVELAMESWRACLSATKGHVEKAVMVECRGSGKMNMVDVPVRLPDLQTRSKAFEVLAEEGFGAVPERRKVEVDLGEVTLEALRSMSMRELAEIAGLETGEWGPETVEWEPLAQLPPGGVTEEVTDERA